MGLASPAFSNSLPDNEFEVNHFVGNELGQSGCFRLIPVIPGHGGCRPGQNRDNFFSLQSVVWHIQSRELRQLLHGKKTSVVIFFATNRLFRKVHRRLDFVEENLVERGVVTIFGTVSYRYAGDLIDPVSPSYLEAR